MIIDIKATSLNGQFFQAQTVGCSLDSISKHHYSIVAKLETLLDEGDFVDELTFNVVRIKRCNVKMLVNSKGVSGQVQQGNYKLVDLI